MSKWGTAFDILRDVMYGHSLWMDNYEQLVLTFIYRRTQMYSNHWATIPIRHFTDGFWTRKDGPIAPRVAISREKLFQSLNHLEAKRIIEVRPGEAVNRGNSYRVRGDNEIDQTQMLRYIMEHQPLLLHSIYRELCKNSKYLPEPYQDLLDAIKKEYTRRRNRPINPVIRRRLDAVMDNMVERQRIARQQQRDQELVSLPTNDWSAGRPTASTNTDQLYEPNKIEEPIKIASPVAGRPATRLRRISIPKK